MTRLKLFYQRCVVPAALLLGLIVGAPAALLLGLIVGAPDTELATAAPLGFLERYTPLINQTEGGAIVKVAEDCGIGNFRDEYGHCRHYGFGAPPAPPGEACPPDRHFVHWVNHSGGRCIPNY
jgi:hypothetical protein